MEISNSWVRNFEKYMQRVNTMQNEMNNLKIKKIYGEELDIWTTH